MSRRTPRGSTRGIELPPAVAAAMKQELPEVADRIVATITEEVPPYAGALAGDMGETIRSAVQLALGGFLNLAVRSHGSDSAAPLAPALQGAYQLGRGEARAGRSMEALLAAYRIGARTAWRDLSGAAVGAGLTATELSLFAELVFAYIDELSASSAAGHTDELESTGRVQRRHLERLARALLTGAPADAVVAAAERAGWEPPEALTAVLVPEAQGRPVLTQVDPRSLHPVEDPPGVPEGWAVVLVAEAKPSTAARARLLRTLDRHDALVGPTVPWLDVPTSFARALRCRDLPAAGSGTVDSEEHLAAIILGQDPDALAALRERVLAPLADLTDSAQEKLTETLRQWLLHHGRRDAVAEALFVHPQTVRYRVGQLREHYGDLLDDPAFVLDATVALGGTA